MVLLLDRLVDEVVVGARCQKSIQEYRRKFADPENLCIFSRVQIKELRLQAEANHSSGEVLCTRAFVLCYCL